MGDPTPRQSLFVELAAGLRGSTYGAVNTATITESIETSDSDESVTPLLVGS